MKKTLSYIATLLLVWTAASCTDEVITNEQSQELLITAGIGDPSRVTFINEDEVTKTHWKTNDQIGLYTSNQSNVSYQALSDGKYSKFKATTGTTIKSEEGKVIKGYYPYSSKTSGKEAPLPYTISRKASDGTPAFMYGESTISDGEVSLAFKHVFAYLKVTVSTNMIKEKMPDGSTLDKTGFYIDSDAPVSVYNASFNMDTQQITHYGNTDVTRMFHYTDDIDYDDDAKHTYLIPILPQPGKTSFIVYLFYAIKDNDSQVSLSYLANGQTPSEGFQAGNVYEYDATLTSSDKLYHSTDYSKDGEVFTIQKATKGKGIDLVFLGEGFVDKDMAAGGKYETKMKEAVDKMFELEPYKSLQDRFNIYGVKVVSPTAEFIEGAEKRINEDYATAFTYAAKVNLPANTRRMVAVIYNTNHYVDRSYCGLYSNGDFVAFNMDVIDNTLIHEVCGHGIAKLADEYVEGGQENLSLSEEEKNTLDQMYLVDWGWYANVDYHNTKNTVRWAQLLNDSRYANDNIGIYEGAYYVGKGAYRPSKNSMMNSNISWFNAPSREAIYKAVMTLSEGNTWSYDYEQFVAFDSKNIGTAPQSARSASQEPNVEEIRKKHRKPVLLKGSWRDAIQNNQNSTAIIPLR